MTTRQLHQNIIQQLVQIYPKVEAEQISYRLIDFHLGLSKVDMALAPQTLVSDSQKGLIDTSVQRLLVHEPLQYILGEADFYDLLFKVDANVLIPRPETEELVHLIINQHKGQALSILDIGTGSGCIPISLKKNLPGVSVNACDISEGALAIAASNAKLYDVEVSFFHCDILDQNNWRSERYDIIVSNPPYVLDSEKEVMRDNVLSYEPHLALFVDDDVPLLFYKKIADFALQALNKNGRLYFEINEAYGMATKTMLEEKGFVKVQIHHDLFDKARMVSAVLE